MIAPTCRHDLTTASFTAEDTLVGPDAIVQSYHQHDTRARHLFDSVDYSSGVETIDGMTAVIRFTDVLMKAGQQHIYSCRQRISVNKSELIESIVQEDIPEETAAARAFMERVGVTFVN
jgi:hypothetical protein